MNEQIEQDWLDRRLQEAALYIQDDGFTARVLQQLPAPRPAGQFLRPFILVGMSALARRRTYGLCDGGRFILVEMFTLATIPTLWGGAFALARGLLVVARCIF